MMGRRRCAVVAGVAGSSHGPLGLEVSNSWMAGTRPAMTQAAAALGLAAALGAAAARRLAVVLRVAAARRLAVVLGVVTARVVVSALLLAMAQPAAGTAPATDLARLFRMAACRLAGPGTA